MIHRFSTWWRALSVVLLSLAAVTWPSAAQAGATPTFDVVHQNALTTLSAQGTTHFNTTFRLPSSNGKTSADVSIFPALTAPGELTPYLNGLGTSAAPLSSTGSFSLDCLKHGLATIDILLYTNQPSPTKRSCNEVAPRLHVTCASNGCAGVYPLRYSVNVDGSIVTKWSLLSVRTNTPTTALQVAYVETLMTAALRNPLHSLNVLDTLGHFSGVPLTLGADYETLSAMESSPTESTVWRTALNKAITSPLHRVIDAPPGNVDFAGLVANNLTTQVTQQLSLTSKILQTLTGRYVDGSVLLSGPQSPASLLALRGAGVHDVVLPESDLSVAPSSTLTWGTPFSLTGASPITALSSDGPLSKLVNNSAIEPGRRAALALATLAYLDFEAPTTSTPRTVVIEAPLSSTSSTFVADFLNGMQGNPLSKLASLSPSFNESLVGANGTPAIRTLNAPISTATWSARNVSTLLTLIGNVTSYTQGIKSGDEATQLHVAVARSEISGGANQRQNAINAAQRLLDAQLAQFSVNESAVTLAGSGTSLPITVISRADYTVVAHVHIVTDRLSFPDGNTVSVTMNSPTQSIRVATANARGSSLILQVVLTTPNGQVVLARGAIQVRVAGTSVIGYLLTFASLFVLGLWWWRTNKRRSRGRHAR